MSQFEKRPLALVTGASSGIGYELAKQFAEHGFDLVVVAEHRGIVETRTPLEALGAAVETVQADLATYEGVERFWARVLALGRPVAAAALNAGVGVGGPFADTDLRAELNLIQLNVVSTVHLAKRLVAEMLYRGKGRLLFTSSIAATMPAPFEAAYGASIAFVQSFAEALRNELKDRGITVTALQPGPTDTNFFHRAGMDAKLAAKEKDDPADVARDGFEALMARKDHVVAGAFKNKAQAAGAKFMPQPASAAVHRNLSEPGSAEDVKE